ncbi:MAG: hypothetical protein WBW84_02340 [Acidobacteriaceae bacterium]
MLKQRSSFRNQTADVSRVDQLLLVLRAAVRHDPPADLRARLAEMSSARLGEDPPQRISRTPLLRRPIFTIPAIGLIAAILIACAAFIGFFVHEEAPGGKMNRIAREEPTAAVPAATNVTAPLLVAKPHRRSRAPRSENDAGRPGNLVISLPYSDSAVDTGTGTMIRVSLSQDELLSLGVSLNPTVDDRRFMAEMILGDDGLPRAISVPLPLTAVEAGK